MGKLQDRENKRVPGMQFTCTRSWERMAPMEGGRFCDSCQKPVIDFTIVDRDLLKADEVGLRKAKVVATVVNGEIVFK